MKFFSNNIQSNVNCEKISIDLVENIKGTITGTFVMPLVPA
jgi:hypothetical protein